MRYTILILAELGTAAEPGSTFEMAPLNGVAKGLPLLLGFVATISRVCIPPVLLSRLDSLSPFDYFIGSGVLAMSL